MFEVLAPLTGNRIICKDAAEARRVAEWAEWVRSQPRAEGLLLDRVAPQERHCGAPTQHTRNGVVISCFYVLLPDQICPYHGKR